MSLPVAGKSHRPPRTRWDQIPRMLQAQGLDVLVTVSPENVTYTGGFYEYTLPIIRDRISATLIPAMGEPVYLVVDKFEGTARRNSWIKEMATYRENADSPIRVLAGILEERGFGAGTIAIEQEYLSAGYLEELRGYLPRASFQDGSVILARTRSVKTDDEVAFIEAAVKATETSHLKVYRTMKPGDKEIEIARRVRAQNLIEGADFVDHSFVAAGRNTLEGHHIPDETPIRRGDVVVIDSGGKFAGYYSDMSRPVVVGKPNARQQSMWRRLHDVQRKCVESLRVGVRAGEAYAPLRQQREYEDVWFYGHGLGVFVHDPPMLTQYYEDGMKTTTNLSTIWELEPNMLVMVEIGFADREGGQWYTFEDLVLVTEGGPRILSSVIDTAEMFVVE